MRLKMPATSSWAGVTSSHPASWSKRCELVHGNSEGFPPHRLPSILRASSSILSIPFSPPSKFTTLFRVKIPQKVVLPTAMVVAASAILKEKLQATEVLDREFEEIRILGSGGQGTVSLCKDQATGTLFAVKTVLSRSGDEDLEHEFDTVRHLMESGVEGIVPIHDVDRDELGQLFVLMDFCNRGSLYSVLQRRRGSRLQEREAAAVVRSVTATLMKCHSLGVMHRDIKPENVLVHCTTGSTRSSQSKNNNNKRQRTTESGDPESTAITEFENEACAEEDLEEGCKFLLSDFGLARRFRAGHHLRDGSVAGTPQYVAPEMLIKRSYDERADVWSLGVLLHRILTGALPPQSSEMVRLLTEGLHYDCEHDRVWNMDWSNPMYSRLSEGARSVLGGMLKRKPKHRMSLTDICQHPWVQQKEQSYKVTTTTAVATPARKRIRLVYGAGNNNNKNKHEEGTTHQKPRPAPLVIRFKLEGNIIREIRREYCNEGQQQKLFPIPLPVL